MRLINFQAYWNRTVFQYMLADNHIRYLFVGQFPCKTGLHQRCVCRKIGVYSFPGDDISVWGGCTRMSDDIPQAQTRNIT